MAPTIERNAARLFSTAVFRPLLAGKSSELADDVVAELRWNLDVDRSEANLTVVNRAYEVVRRTYRSEYFYKNTIASKILVGRHRARNVAFLPELHIGGSIADCVVINGSGVVYEIKTEFDSPEKLQSQVADYLRVFPLVNVVAHASAVGRYLRALEGTPVGLIAVGPRSRMSVAKVAVEDSASFDARVIFNVLRVEEAVRVIGQHYAEVPDVPSGHRYSALLSLAEEIPVAEFQRSAQTVLRDRGPRRSQGMLLDGRLAPMRALIAQLDPGPVQQEHLDRWLEAKGA